MWQKLLLLSLLGIAGTLSRYWVQSWIHEATGGGFPWGTLAVNVLGCFLIGLLTMLAVQRQLITDETRAIVAIGFLGAFTTFSSFAYETAALLEHQKWFSAAANMILQNVLGIVAVFAGFAIGRMF